MSCEEHAHFYAPVLKEFPRDELIASIEADNGSCIMDPTEEFTQIPNFNVAY